MVILFVVFGVDVDEDCLFFGYFMMFDGYLFGFF